MTNHRTKRETIWFRMKLIAISAGVFLFTGWMILGEGGFRDSRELRLDRDRKAEQIAILEARKIKIEQYLTCLQEGDELAYETAARRYGLVGRDETIYKIKIEPEAEPK